MPIYIIPPGNWSINADGMTGTLEVTYDGKGGFSGKALGTDIRGIWQEQTGDFLFLRPAASEFYTGKLSPLLDHPEGGTFRISGTFDNGSGNRPWFAEKIVVP